MKRRAFIKIAYFTVLAQIIALSAAFAAETFDALVASGPIRLAVEGKSLPATIYLAPNGNDAWSGRLASPNAEGTDGPLATFAAAQKAVRNFRKSAEFDGKPTIVRAAAGIYSITEPLTFGPDDSGTADSPILWTADGEARLSGGCFLHDARPVTDAAILERLKPEVREKVVRFDLAAAGLSDLGSADGNGPELFFDGRPMTLSRYPNDGFIKITDLVREGTTVADIRGTKGIHEAFFMFDDEGPLRWEKENDVWVLGYWFWDWSNQRQKVASIDGEKKIMRLEPPYHDYGYRVGQWFYAYNLLCEIDVPGEYYIDRESKTLYFYPPEPIDGQEIALTGVPEIVRAKNVSNLVFSGLTLEGARGDAMTLSGCDGVTLFDLVFRNGGRAGLAASGKNLTVFGSHFYQLGSAGMSVSGGNRETLEPGGIEVVNNTIHDYGRVIRMYAAGICFNGVGIHVANNKITDAPHCAMLFGGNDHLIERNEIARVCQESNDAGAIYCGRNWTMRGNRVKNNFLHDITGFEGRGCVGVYLDDMFSSCDIVGNLFVNVTRAAMIGGGRDNHVIGNIFVNCNPSLHIDARALGWCADHADGWLKEAAEKGTISGIAWNKPPYSERYPELAKILDGQPKAPEGNVIAKNICVGGTWDVTKNGQWQGDSVEKAARPFQTFKDNLVDVDPLFVDAAAGDYRLKPESPAWAVGFEPIPYDEIGVKDFDGEKK